MWFFSGALTSAYRVQRLSQVRNNVGDIFDADREANHGVTDAAFRPLFRGQLTVRRDGGCACQGIDIPEGRGGGEEAEPLKKRRERFGGLSRAIEGDQGAQKFAETLWFQRLVWVRFIPWGFYRL